MGERDSISIARKSRTNKLILILGCDETLWASATASVLPEKAGLINSPFS